MAPLLWLRGPGPSHPRQARSVRELLRVRRPRTLLRRWAGASASTDATWVRVRWDDGYALEDEIENGIALLFGARNELERATVEFLDASGRVIGAHATFIDER